MPSSMLIGETMMAVDDPALQKSIAIFNLDTINL